MIQKHEELRGFLEMIVYAKEKGMMDHREAKELWLSAIVEVGGKVDRSGGRQVG